jgi:Trk K+ transport system NAD-binding subunit
VLPEPDTVLQEGDLLHVIVRVADRDAVYEQLSQPPAAREVKQ